MKGSVEVMDDIGVIKGRKERVMQRRVEVVREEGSER